MQKEIEEDRIKELESLLRDCVQWLSIIEMDWFRSGRNSSLINRIYTVLTGKPRKEPLPQRHSHGKSTPLAIKFPLHQDYLYQVEAREHLERTLRRMRTEVNHRRRIERILLGALVISFFIWATAWCYSVGLIDLDFIGLP